jgi:hypothetical protein
MFTRRLKIDFRPASPRAMEGKSFAHKAPVELIDALSA